MPDALNDAAFRAVVDEAPDAIVLVGGDGRIVFVNIQVEELFGYARAELVGQRVELLIPEDRRSIHLIHREIFQERPTRRPMGIGLELSGRRKDGSTFPAEISLNSFTDGDTVLSVAAVRDVTRQRRAEEALRRSEERHRLLNERAEGIVFRYRLLPTPGFEYVSSSVARSLGYAPEAFYVDDDLVYAIAEGEDRDLLRRILSAAPPRDATVRLLTRDGEARWFEWSVATVGDADAAIVALEGTARDITERLAAEAERVSLEAEIDLQAERSRIAGDLHDDTIQSINALGLGLHAARDDASVTKEAAIDRTIEGLSSVITALRTYMQQLSGFGDDDVVSAALVSRISALIDPRAPTRWVVDIEADMRLDAALDRQMFLLAKELISNVQRHAQASTASLCLLHDAAGDLVLEVADNGVGFGPRQVAAGSFGLRSVELRTSTIGAQLEIDSTEGGGTRVHIALQASGAAPTDRREE